MVKKAKFTAEEVELGKPSATTKDTKKVIAVLIQNFVKEEKGNRVTSNNMLALNIAINQAIDGLITINQPGEGEPTQ